MNLKKSVLIIGGSRFVGPLLIEKLLRAGHDVTVFNRGRIPQVYPNEARFIKGDRNNGFSFSERFDAVIDMCAYSGAQTKHALDELKFDFFVHVSTAAVYRKAEVFPLTEDSPIGLWSPWDSYNKGKVECESVLKKSGVKYASIRPVYILGPKNYCNREQFIYSRIKSGLPIVLPGNGQALVQFVFAKEVAETLASFVEKQIEGVFNCAGSEVITLKGLVKEMGEIMGIRPVVKYNPAADGENFDISEFPFANESLILSNEKIKRLGVKFAPLPRELKKDYENYYRHVI